MYVYINAAQPLPKKGPTQYNQCSVQMPEMNAALNDLAGFMDAPVTGMPKMDNVM